MACKRKIDTSLNTTLTAPIVKSTITVNNIVNQENGYTDTNDLVHFNINENLLDFNLLDIIVFPDTGIPKSFTVDSLSLKDNIINYPITLGDIARGIGGINGTLLLLSHGGQSIIPPIENLSAGEIEINANDFFQEAILENGTMMVSIENNLPIPIENLGYTFRNRGNQEIVAEGIFYTISAGESLVDSFNLAGKTIEGDLEVLLSDFSSPGSNGQLIDIDTSDALNIELIVKDLEVFQATAIFPTQNLVNDHNDMELENLGADLIEIKAASGTFLVDMFSTSQDTLYFEYDFPGMIRDGESFSNLIKLNPGSADNPSTKQVSFDLSNYVFDLTGLNQNTVNSIGSRFRIYIDSSGIITTLSKSDSFYILYSFENLKPAHVIGNIHDTTLKIGPNISYFDAFDPIKNGVLSFEQASSKISIENGLGIKANLQLDTLLARKDRNSLLLESDAISQAIGINPAIYRDSVFTTQANIELNNSNSNFVELLNLLPDLFLYSARVNLNPDQDTSYNHFAYSGSGVNIDLNIDVPLKVKAKNLRFADTLEINLNENIDITTIEEITIMYQNTFPFELDPTFIFLDSLYHIQDSIVLDETIKNSKLVSSFTTPLSSKESNLFKSAKYISIVTKLNSTGIKDNSVNIEQGQFLTIQLLLDTAFELIE